MRRRLQAAMAILALTAFVGGCGGGGDKADTTATTGTDVQSTALPGLPEIFVPIAGLTYVELPDSVLEDLQAQFASDPATKKAVAAADGRSITRDDEPVAVVIAVGFDKKSAALPGVEAGFVSGATGSAVTKRQLTLAGEDATIGTASDGTLTIAWLKGTLALVIIGGDEGALTNVATALIAANK